MNLNIWSLLIVMNCKYSLLYWRSGHLGSLNHSYLSTFFLLHFPIYQTGWHDNRFINAQHILDQSDRSLESDYFTEKIAYKVCWAWQESADMFVTAGRVWKFNPKFYNCFWRFTFTTSYSSLEIKKHVAYSWSLQHSLCCRIKVIHQPFKWN